MQKTQSSTTKTTFCRICEPMCPLHAEVDDQGEVTKLKPHPEHMSGCKPCAKGLYFLDLHKDPDRLNHPLQRTNPRSEARGNFERVSWDDSLADIGHRLKAVREKYGKQSVGYYFGNPLVFNSRGLFTSFQFAHTLETPMRFSAGTQDVQNKQAVAGAIYGNQMAFMAPDLYHTDYLLCLGTNPKVSHWTAVSVPADAGKVLKEIKARGGKVRFVNPRNIESSNANTGDTLQIKPGSDAYFLAALLNEIILCDGVDQAHVERYGNNFEPLREFVARFPASKVEKVTGITADTVATVARELSEANSAAVYMSTGVNQGRQGVICFWLVEMINFLTGNLGRKGGTFLPPGINLFAEPASQTLSILKTSFGDFPHIEGPSIDLPAALLPDLIEGGDIRALVVIAGNPLLSVGGEERLRKAFEKLELLVVIDIQHSDTAELADYVLPATDWLEHADINVLSIGKQQIPYVQYTEAMTEPAAERREDWWILSRILQEVGLPSQLDLPDNEDGFNGVEQYLGAGGLSLEQLRRAPDGTVPLDQEDRASLYESVMLFDDKKVNCFPEIIADAGLFERHEQIFQELSNESEDALKLITIRTPFMHNTWMSNLEILRGRHSFNPLHICQEDAERRNLQDGDTVRVFNQYGSVETRLKIDNDFIQGAVGMTHGYGQSKAYNMRVASANPGANYNSLMPTGPDSFERFSAMSWLSGVPVQVERYEKNEKEHRISVTQISKLKGNAMSFTQQIEQLFNTRMLVIDPSEKAQSEMEKIAAQGIPSASFKALTTPEDWQAVRQAYDEGIGIPPLPPFRQRWMDKGASRAENMMIDGPDGQLEMRLLVPEGEIKGAVFHTHGGGWVSCTPSTFDDKYAHAAELCGLVVGSVNYRKAPEHPYPAAMNDCETAALWFNDYVKQQYGIDKVIIHGISAGGHLGAATALRMHQKHGYQYAGAVFEIGCYDFSNGMPSRIRVDGRCLLGLDSNSMDELRSLYLQNGEDDRDPDISPLYASNEQLQGMSPVLFTCCELDPICDDTPLYFMRHIQAGNDAYCMIFNGVGHNVDTLDSEEAELNVAVIAAFMNRCIENA